jgi:hypothetical protein
VPVPLAPQERKSGVEDRVNPFGQRDRAEQLRLDHEARKKGRFALAGPLAYHA